MFKLTPPTISGGAWTESVLYRFTGGSDGNNPWARLIFDAAGALYGTTGGEAGGPAGAGTVFKLTPPTISGGAWTETVLHTFCSQSNCNDGFEPIAGLIFDTSGALYGTTFSGGTSGVGTVFKLTPPATSGGAWTETVLYSFTGGSDGKFPYHSDGLIFDAAGALYGTTWEGGGSGCGGSGCGTVFKLTAPTSSGGIWTETVLYAFTGGSDGASPQAGVILDAAGALYGTTASGGGTSGAGTVFKLTPPTISGGAWTETVLHSFTDSGGDGASPQAGLVIDTAGNLYGTTEVGGSSGLGTVFNLTVQTPQQATQAIINSVNALFAQGVLNGGQDNSLVRQLQQAINLMNAGKNAGAIGNLDSFISEVNDLLSSGVLSASQAASLVSAAESVIAQLS